MTQPSNKAKLLRSLRFATRVAFGAILAAVSVASADEPAKYRHGVIIRFEGEITAGLEAYFDRKLDAAKEEGADLVIVEIDSPGGGLAESLDIAERLQNVDWAHTVAYVPHWAYSGAAIVALGCDEIIMAPSGVIGDAGAIVMGKYSQWHYAPEKIISALKAALRSLAEAKHRPPALAEAISDKDHKVFHVRNLKSGQETYISDMDFKAAPDGTWQKLGEVAASGDNRFMALTGKEAAEVGLANALIDSRDELKKRYGLTELAVLEPTAIDITVDFLNWWLITGLLLIVGLTGLYMEAMAPGHAVGGVIGAACFLLLFWSHFLGGTAGWLAVMLFVVGISCIGVEIFLLPGTIVPGLVGAVVVVVSLVMASQGFLIPQSAEQLQTLAGTMGTIVASCCVFIGVAIVFTRRMDSVPLLNRLMLAPPDGDSEAAKADAAGEDSIRAGDLGVAHTPLRPGGKGRFGERTIDVLASGDFLDRGTPIRVVRVTGNQVVVEVVE